MSSIAPIASVLSAPRDVELADRVRFSAERAGGGGTFARLQEAVDFVADAGGVVRVPPGDIPLGETLRVGSRVRLVGAGRDVTRLVALDPAMDAILIEGSKSAVENLGVTRAVSGPVGPGLGAGIVFRRQTFDVLLGDVRIERHGVGIRHTTERPGDQADASYFLRLRAVIVEKTFEALGYFENITEMIMSDCAFLLGAGDGLILRNFANSRLGRSFVYGCRGVGVKIEKSPSYFLAENIFFSEFIVDSTGGHALVMDDCSRVSYRSGWVASAGAALGPAALDWDGYWQVDWTSRTGRDAVGVLIGASCDDIQIANNYIMNCSGDGVRLVAPREAAVSNNVIHSNGRAAAGSAGIRLAPSGRGDCGRVQILGNRCRNDPQFIHQGKTGAQAFGFFAAARGCALLAAGNDFSDPLHESDLVVQIEPDSGVIRDNLGRERRPGRAPARWARGAARSLAAPAAGLARLLAPAALRAKISPKLRALAARVGLR